MRSKQFPTDLIRESVLNGESDVVAGIEFIESTGWQDDGKYDYCTYYFRDLSDGRIYSIDDSRSGSYFSDYHYGSSDWRVVTVECIEVERVTKIVNTWRPVGTSVTPSIDYDVLVTAAHEFIAKVDSGAARSVRSYAAFKSALGLVSSE